MTAGTSELSDYIEANVVYGQGLEQKSLYAISNTFLVLWTQCGSCFQTLGEVIMNLNEIKDLMAQFDQSSLREFYKNGADELQFSKNEARMA